jgi:hypothetical protein
MQSVQAMLSISGRRVQRNCGLPLAEMWMAGVLPKARIRGLRNAPIAALP